MEAAPSGTGVFYQAMPATGADGKKIMKLIPVHMVNGQFVPTRVSKPKADRPPLKAAAVDVALDFLRVAGKSTADPSAAQPCSRKETSQHMTVLSNAGASGIGHPITKHLPQQQTINYSRQVPPNPAVSMNSREPLRLTNQFPLTVKSPALPRGQYLQIPPTAQAQSVPAYRLPSAPMKQIFPTQKALCTGSSPPTMSPVTNVHQGVSQPGESVPRAAGLLSKECSNGNQGALPVCTKPHLKLIPKVSQRPNSPTRWVVEEIGDSGAVEPQLPASVSTSKMKSNKERGIVFKKAGPHRINQNGGSGLGIPVEEENKAAELSEKCSRPPSATPESLHAAETIEKVSSQCEAGEAAPCQTRQSDSSPAEKKALLVFDGKVFFVAKKCSPAALKRKRPRQVDEVIDLCDDEAQEDRPWRAAFGPTPPSSQADEDTVIFVSYRPPKSPVRPVSDLLPSVRAEEGASRRASSGARPERSATGGLESGAGDPAGLNMTNRTESSVPHPGFLGVDAGAESPTPQRCSQSGNHKVASATDLKCSWTPSQAPKPCPVTDQQLRRIHGITANVRVCLRRTDGAAAGPPAQDHAELPQGVRGREPSSMQELHVPRAPLSVQSGSVGTGQESPAAPHAALPLARRQVFEVNTETPSNHKCHSSQTAPCEMESVPLIGYMEPIDESFLSACESGDPAAQPHARMCTVTGASMRRLGRTRKRTVCPCCSPSAVDPARKPIAQVQEPTLAAEQVSKRGSRTKALAGEQLCRHDGSAGRSRQNCRAQEAPASDCPSAAPVDSDPVKAGKAGDLELRRSATS